MTMTQAEIDTFLSGVYLARVATVRADDRPHVVPVWYLWEDGILYFETARTSVKVKNLQANSNIAITVDVTAGGLRLRYVIMEGQAEFIEDADSPAPWPSVSMPATSEQKAWRHRPCRRCSTAII
jgi:nitroimidazol reductase NimA-like FMN-containing flavoprotein (pyridoxamine 5'-phosphate oxidase superfamily)